MKVLITGSGGLIGNEACIHWLNTGAQVFGIDNNMRKRFFGVGGDVSENILMLSSYKNYIHCNIDIRDREGIEDLFRKNSFDVIIHCAAQPSHDKAAQIPFLDFETNALGTLNLLESFRKNKKEHSTFIHVSTNKVYGDSPNYIEMIEGDLRYDFSDPKYRDGIDESLSIPNATQILWGYRNFDFSNIKKLTVPTQPYRTDDGKEVLILSNNFYNFINSQDLLDQ